jgi:hypothetical protein
MEMAPLALMKVTVVMTAILYHPGQFLTKEL